jgi:transposase
MTLFQLVQRRSDLKQILVAEKNRAKSPGSKLVKESCIKIIEVISEQIEEITSKIAALVEDDPILKKKQEILRSVPGIGNIVSIELLVLLPELGSINRKKIASLAGLAPLARDSGTCQGYRRTNHGRNGVKPMLFLAAMAARQSKSELKTFYEKLIKKGKKKMVALIALMRKILVIANARLKELGV